MKPTEDLFNLIKSLSKSEKANFRKFAQRHVIRGKNNYLKLYDLISSQKIYDEKKFKEDVKNEKFSGHVHVIKNYLFKLILKSLKEFYLSRYIDHKLYEKITFVEIMVDKGLHSSAKKLLNKTKIEAGNRQKEYLIFKILDIETSLSLSPDITSKTNRVLEGIIKSKRHFGKHLMLKSELKNLFDSQNLILKIRSQIRTPKDEQILRSIMENPLLETENTELSLEGIFYKYVMKIKFHLAMADMHSYKITAEELLNEFNKNPVELENNTTLYFVIALQYLDYCISTGNVADFESRLKDYLKIFGSTRKTDFENRFFAEHRLTFEGIMLKYYNRLKDMENFITTLDKIDLLLKEYKDVVPPRRELNLSIIISEMVFMNGLFDKSLYWVNKIINFPSHPSKEDVYQTAIVLSVMIHYELRNYELMEYTISNAIKHFRKSNRLLDSERALFKFIRKAAYISDKKKLLEEFSILENKLEILSKTERENTFFNRLHLNSWVKMKLEKLNSL